MGRNLDWILAIFFLLLAVGSSAFQVVAAFARDPASRIDHPATTLHAVPTLEDWVVQPNGRVKGKIRNHPEIEDGSVVSTSPITDPEDAVGKNVVSVQTFSGSQYLLLDPSPEMEEVMTSENYFAMPTESMQLGQGEELSETKKLMQQVKDAGVAGVMSYALWELGFWTVSVPVCVAAYRQVSGHWPDFSNQDDLKQLGAEAFAFVNVARFAVPLRIGLALSTTPWIQKNIVDRFSNQKFNQ